jgi:predicted enzyme related to lactoylglutathione lyase
MDNPVTWFELVGPEREQTAKFYAELFGWHTESLPEFEYVLVDTHAGRGINGGFGASPDGRASVSFYVQCTDLQGALDRAASLGGRTIVPVTETMMVTFAQFADPAGNAIGLVAPSEQGGDVSAGDGVPVDWFEVSAPDPRALWDFYRELFGWDIHEGGTDEFLYGEVHPAEGEDGIGGGIGSSPDGQPHVTLYAQVSELQACLDRAQTLGGSTVMPPTEISDLSFAMLADPQGSTFGLYVPKQT